jgi:hypothetical protein
MKSSSPENKVMPVVGSPQTGQPHRQKGVSSKADIGNFMSVFGVTTDVI